MNQKTHIRVPRGSRIFPERPPLSDAEIARRKAEDEAFGKRCREIFNRVYPELVKDCYDWFILIEPDSGDYFIDPDREIARQEAKKKHPTAVLMAMRLNETGTCGRI
ncbi:hypothetical protein LAY57_33045 [Argonema antarcticum A004/B2]|nr:hypothetical protein [Argonema antarcticum]MCL1475449.1 hypothetical protein [Argonema antarcticum A004/B2]